MEPAIETGIVYQHYRTGGLYLVEAFALNTHTDGLMVVYRSLHDGRCYVRDYDEFRGYVQHDGQTVKRFTRWEGQ